MKPQVHVFVMEYPVDNTVNVVSKLHCSWQIFLNVVITFRLCAPNSRWMGQTRVASWGGYCLCYLLFQTAMFSQVARFMWPTWAPPVSCRPQVGPMLAPWTLLSGLVLLLSGCISYRVLRVALYQKSVGPKLGTVTACCTHFYTLLFIQKGHCTFENPK